MEDHTKTKDDILSGWHFKAFIWTLIIAVIVYLIFIIWGGWEQVLSAVHMIGFKGFAVALALSLINYTLRFLRWQGYLNALGYPVPWLPSLRIYIAGFALTTTPGKAGEAIRSLFLKKYGIPYRKSLGAFFSERASDLIGVVILSSFTLWNYKNAKPIIIAVGIFLILVLAIVQKRSWLLAIENFAKAKFPPRFAHWIEFGIEMVLSFKKCYEPKALIIGTTLSVLAWAAEGVALYYLLHLLNSSIDLTITIFIYSFSLLIGSITFLPGGLGGAEVTMIELLRLQGVPLPITIAATIIIRLTTLWFAVVLGLIALPKNYKAKP